MYNIAEPRMRKLFRYGLESLTTLHHKQTNKQENKQHTFSRTVIPYKKQGMYMYMYTVILKYLGSIIYVNDRKQAAGNKYIPNCPIKSGLV